MSEPVAFELPWPPGPLWPNRQGHWAKTYKARKAYKDAVAWICLGNKVAFKGAYGVIARITFHPPDRRKRDMDNMLAAIKSGIDAVATYTGIDDSAWRMNIRRGEPVKGGRVVIELTPVKDGKESAA